MKPKNYTFTRNYRNEQPTPTPPPTPKPPKPTGLGDRVERIAQPIAKVIDTALGTDIQNCGGCQKRKQWLNERFPET